MKLFDSTAIGGAPMRNKIALAPMTTYSGNEDLTPSKAELDYYRIRAKDLGMVITAAISVNENAQAFPRQITLKNDTFIEPMRTLVDAIKDEGSLAIAQLHHGGRMNEPGLYEDKTRIVSASAVKAPREGFLTPRAMTKEEIGQTVDDFAAATRRAIDAGFDGIELHGANTYLLQQFFSSHSNRRDDEFGGSREKRFRFIDEVIDAANAVIETHAEGPFIIGYRFSPEELEEDGITIDDTLWLVKQLRNKSLDYLHVSLGAYNQTPLNDPSDKEPIVKKIQGVLNKAVPLMGAGGLSSLDAFDDAAALGYDLFAVGFAMLVDPDFIQKMKKGAPLSKYVDPSTMPPALYQRLLRNKKRFEPKGFRF